MVNLMNNGYYPLDHFYLDMYVPSHPGVYTLSLRRSNGSHETFLSGQAENLHRTLRAIIRKDPVIVPQSLIDQLEEHKCFFTFFVIIDQDHRNEVEKMLTYTEDPVIKLKAVACF